MRKSRALGSDRDPSGTCSVAAMIRSPKESPRRLAYSPEEAAEALGVSRSFFYEHILWDVRVVRVGRKRLIPIKELRRGWIDTPHRCSIRSSARGSALPGEYSEMARRDGVDALT